MSMISAQIDELRRYADRADGTFPMLASALRDAADTIWQLRDDLQRTHERLDDAEHDESRAWDRVHKAEAEADRLRELVRTIYMCSCIQCGRCDYGHGDSCSFDAESELRELGIEVDE